MVIDWSIIAIVIMYDVTNGLSIDIVKLSLTRSKGLLKGTHILPAIILLIATYGTSVSMVNFKQFAIEWFVRSY